MSTYNITRTEEHTEISAFLDGVLYVADDQHQNFQRIIEAVINPDTDPPELARLFDVPLAIGQAFTKLTERVSVANGRIYFDGEEIHTALTTAILRFVDEGATSVLPLVNFMEKIETNKNQHSRAQLFQWLEKHNFSIAEDGDFLAYKGVNTRVEYVEGAGMRYQPTREFVSSNSGTAIVNGVVVEGQIPNPIGAVIEMPRSQVAFAPSEGCSTGLHVGTWEYASTFATHTLLVKVNPRDVVSVPTDCGHQKMRVCRYQVIEEIERPRETLIEEDSDYEGDLDVEFCEYCGESDHDTDECPYEAFDESRCDDAAPEYADEPQARVDTFGPLAWVNGEPVPNERVAEVLQALGELDAHRELDVQIQALENLLEGGED